jgi:hypothetical protein
MRKRSRGSGFVSRLFRWAGPTCLELWRLGGDFGAFLGIALMCLGLWMMVR